MDVEITNLVTRRVDCGQLEGIQSLILKVEDLIALQANEMMVLMDLGVETGRRAGVADSMDDAHADQRIQHAIHGCSRHPRQLSLHIFEELLGGGMIRA